MTTQTLAGPRSAPAVATWLIFPVLLAVMAMLSWRLLQTELPRPLASGAGMLFTVLAVLTLERAFPYHRAWNRRPDGLDLVLLVANRFLDVGMVVLTTLLVTRVNESAGRVLLGGYWPTAWPVAVQVVLGISIAELVRYLLHRLSHRPGLLWSWHRLHHSPERMYVLNGPRLHPLNYLWVTAAHSLPALLLGAELSVVILIVNVTGFFVLFQHANLRLRFDGLNQVFATADVHRLHHAKRGCGVNYSIVLLLIDRVFGTYAPPEDVSDDGIGLQ